MVNGTITTSNIEVAFTLKSKTLSVKTLLELNILTNEVTTISHALLLIEGEDLEEIGRGTYQECYDICVAKKKELEPKVYNWENCFSREGYFIDAYGHNESTGSNLEILQNNKNVYPTKEDAEAALAYCQLLHIVNKINEDYPRVGKYNHQVFVDNELNFDITNIAADEVYEGLILNSKEGAEILIRDNEELLKTYFKIK